jgi:hypothetical protein
MKKAIVLLLLPLCFHLKAQDQDKDQDKEVKKHGFHKEKLFTGGSANVGFSNGATMLGITPQLGYSLTNWLDAGITFNLNYISQRDFFEYGDKMRQTTYGPGAFVRLFPVNFLFAGAQYEYNMIHQKYIPLSTSSNYVSGKSNFNASSLLVGAGYAGGRMKGENTYYYLSIMWDVLSDPHSPYIDNLGRKSPVIRAGYNIGLFQGKNRRERDSYYVP